MKISQQQIGQINYFKVPNRCQKPHFFQKDDFGCKQTTIRRLIWQTSRNCDSSRLQATLLFSLLYIHTCRVQYITVPLLHSRVHYYTSEPEEYSIVLYTFTCSASSYLYTCIVQFTTIAQSMPAQYKTLQYLYTCTVHFCTSLSAQYSRKKQRKSRKKR